MLTSHPGTGQTQSGTREEAPSDDPFRIESATLQALEHCVSPETLIRRNEPLARRTTLRVGGPADVYVEPASETDLAAVLRFCVQRHLPVFILGRGSNLLVRDRGFRGVVVCLSNPLFSRVELGGERFTCGAGARLKAVANEAKRNGLSGFEFLEGIPGTVGGALRMNAGAMGGSTFQLVQSVRFMDFQGVVHESSDLQVEYRACPTLKTNVALSAVFVGKSGRREEIGQRMNEFSRKRWSSQPAAASAGCIFKNPVTVPAGKLIEELGLKGTRVGGATVSFEHGNFIVNDGTATARDVLGLIEVIQRRAKTERDIELETEVEIIGE
jgi:UDP-N-acetylenolpyruvoylglucosamine reductase